MSSSANQYGIAVKLPANDPMSAPHLLGDAWSGTRWYGSAEERDAAFIEMTNHPRYYRKGDVPTIVLEKIDP